MTETEEEPIEPEAYQVIRKRFETAEKEILKQREEIKQLKEMINQNAETKKAEDNRLVGYCTACGHTLTTADIRQPVCPYCNEGKTVSSTRPF